MSGVSALGRIRRERMPAEEQPWQQLEIAPYPTMLSRLPSLAIFRKRLEQSNGTCADGAAQKPFEVVVAQHGVTRDRAVAVREKVVNVDRAFSIEQLGAEQQLALGRLRHRLTIGENGWLVKLAIQPVVGAPFDVEHGRYDRRHEPFSDSVGSGFGHASHQRGEASGLQS